MQTHMNDSQLVTMPQVTQFLAGTEAVTFQPVSRGQTYEWIEQILQRFGYHRLSKGDKSEVVKYMLKVTHYSRQQLVRLIKNHRRTGKCSVRRRPRHVFPCHYTREDVLLLAKVDEWHQTLSGVATKK